MANIGDRLSNTVETGYKRYDDNDNNITYKECALIINSSGNWYNATGHQVTSTTTENYSIKFNFTGTKLRLYFVFYNDRSKDIQINIDNKMIESFSTYDNGTNASKLAYQNLLLSDTEHYVIISNNNISDNHIIFDAIDIDANGELKPYNKLSRYLIKQENKYYSIKPEFYQNGQYSPITLAGGDTPIDDDFSNNGIDDINDLCTRYNTEKYLSSGEVLDDGKLFTFSIPNNIKNINNVD